MSPEVPQKVPNIPNISETELLGVHVCNHHTALAFRLSLPPRTYDAVSMQGTHTHHHHTTTASRSDFLPLVRWVRYPKYGIF